VFIIARLGANMMTISQDWGKWQLKLWALRFLQKPGREAHTYNPSTQEAENCKSEASLGYMVKCYLKKKPKRFS
jgi:hypothetical protein